MIFKNHDVIIKLKNSIPETSEKVLKAKLLDYLENSGIKIEYENQIIDIPFEKIHYTKLNDKIEINKNKGECDD